MRSRDQSATRRADDNDALQRRPDAGDRRDVTAAAMTAFSAERDSNAPENVGACAKIERTVPEHRAHREHTFR
jgi:hypothetical protein